jgi:hypothetical protein
VCFAETRPDHELSTSITYVRLRLDSFPSDKAARRGYSPFGYTRQSRLISFAFVTSARHAEKLRVTGTPPGANVEINGVAVGTTPFEKDTTGGYFHKTKSAVGSRLGHSLVAGLSFDVYSIKEIVLTEGPAEWISLKGRNYGNYFLFKRTISTYGSIPSAQPLPAAFLRTLRPRLQP